MLRTTSQSQATHTNTHTARDHHQLAAADSAARPLNGPHTHRTNAEATASGSVRLTRRRTAETAMHPNPKTRSSPRWYTACACAEIMASRKAGSAVAGG